jgi:hypothetical protein
LPKYVAHYLQQNSGVSRQELEVKIALALAFKLKRCTSLTGKLLYVEAIQEQ